MATNVSERHPELYHYTTAVGLQGILESQQLRATNIAYLNDVEEFVGFFDRRLPPLLKDTIRAVVEKLKATEAGRRKIEDVGGEEKTVHGMTQDSIETLRSVTLEFSKFYITSFCGDSRQEVKSNGLLSQWRGYGLDGGYAIVFRTEGIEKLLRQEGASFQYQFLMLGDVEYYDQNTPEKAAHPETIEAEEAIKKAIYDFILEPTQDKFDPIYYPIHSLCCLHKHPGFREEAEVRIAAVPTNDELFLEAQKSGDKLLRRPTQFVTKNGTPTPYISLFGRQTNGDLTKLPISRIIVGPHPDSLKRQEAVQLLLNQHGIEAEVTVSDIPYLGR